MAFFPQIDSSGHVQSGAWHGYTSHPSQANMRNHPSQLQGQYQTQQHQPDRNQYPVRSRPQVQPNPQLRVPPQPQMNPVAQPYPYPNNNNNPYPGSYYPNPRRPQDRSEGHHQSGFTGTTNTPFNRSQPQLAPQPVQPTHQTWTASSNVPRALSHHPTQAPHPTTTLNDRRQSGFTGTTNTPFNHSQPQLPPQPSTDQVLMASSNVPRVSPHHPIQTSHPTTTLNGNRRRSGSQASTKTVQSSISRASSTRSSKAPQIKSPMLKISLEHPFFCGQRRSLIPDQIPETEVKKSEKSVWDVQQFSLPEDNPALMMIDCVQVCSLSLAWNIREHPSFSKQLGRDGQLHAPPKDFFRPLIKARFKSEVCIKTRQDNPLTECFHRWGCIVVESRDPDGTPPTMKQFLYDIWDYFRTPLTPEECLLFSNDDPSEAGSPTENNATERVKPAATRKRKPRRSDALRGYRRFSGLEVCPWFADTGDLFLYLEPM